MQALSWCLNLLGLIVCCEMEIGYGYLDVFILSGQSNMSGRGGVISKTDNLHSEWDGIVPDECKFEKGSIFRLNADSVWENPQEPLHFDIDTGKTCGIGPGLIFATSVAHHRPESRIGLVPCAKGGTSITEWAKGSELYERMIRRSKAALEGGNKLKALLWYQGESDTTEKELAHHYLYRLEKLVENVRSDLGCDQLPFIQVGITARNHPHPDLLNYVRKAQLALKMPGVYYVDAQGLNLKEDGIHLTTNSQVQLGKMLGDAYIANVIADP